MSETKTLSFHIQGEFITNLARDWYFKEHRPYEKVEELLLDCMCGTDLCKEELKNYAKGILMGKYKLTGNTIDDTFGMDDDGEFDGYKQIDLLNQEILKAKEELKNVIDKYLDLADGMQIKTLKYVKNKDNKQLLANCFPEYYSIREERTGNDLLDNFLKANKFENNYGWLTPEGKFIPVEWGKHQEHANEIVEDNHWEDEFVEWYDKASQLNREKDQNLFKSTEGFGNGLHGDFLVYEKGWILLHNPAQGIANPTFSLSKGMTKAQKEFLFDYYTERGEDEKANAIYDE